jgi:hypothetical protein
MLVVNIQNAGRSKGQEQRESWFPSGGWRQLVERGCHCLTRYDEVSEKPFIDIQITFVFPEIPHIVALRQHAP